MDTYFKIQYIHCLHSAFRFYFYSYFRDSKIRAVLLSILLLATTAYSLLLSCYSLYPLITHGFLLVALTARCPLLAYSMCFKPLLSLPQPSFTLHSVWVEL